MLKTEHLPRWLWASFTKAFDSLKGDLPLYIEGHDRTLRPENSLEFRMDGPYIQQPSKDYYIVEVEVNVLVSTIKNEQDSHKMAKNIGVAVTMFQPQITIYQYGDGVDDNRTTVVGCMSLQTGGRDAIIVSNFGLVQGTNNLMQSTVEGHYKMILT